MSRGDIITEMSPLSQFARTLAAGAVWAALGLAAAIPIFIWGSDKAPEFYGSFTAAIVAAIAVVLGAYYQAELTRRRDDEIAKQERIAEATDLFLWLQHAMSEMKFVGKTLHSFHDRLEVTGKDKLDISLEQYRAAVSSRFMEELRDRAKTAARLSPTLGTIVSPALYEAFLAVDRVYYFRGAPESARFGLEDIDQHIEITDFHVKQMARAQIAVQQFLVDHRVPALQLAE